MRDIDRALADIGAIRSQLARDQIFCGYGPAAMAATGLLAALVAMTQSLWFADQGPFAFFATWVGTAALAALLIGAEAMTRSRRHHSRLADHMIVVAVEDFLPAAAAGLLLLVVLARVEPGALWMLPALWQVLVGLGLFAASRTLPRLIVLVAAWYVVTGLATLILASATHVPTPAMMGVPFATGQILLALILHRSLKADDVQP